MRKSEVSALEAILTDPENSSRTAAEVAELCLQALADSDFAKQLRTEEVDRVAKKVVEAIEGDQVGGIPARVADALDRMRSITHRLAVVGQIQHEAPGPVHTVILGPFSSRGVLDSEEKFLKAVQGGSVARQVGQHLAWDVKTGRGTGRFMLAPMFQSARDAWDFYRGEGPAEHVAEVVEHLPRSITPVCACGLRARPACHFCGRAMEHHCPLHEPGAEIHRCSAAG